MEGKVVIVLIVACSLVSSGLTYGVLNVQQSHNELDYQMRIDLLESKIYSLNLTLELLNNSLNDVEVSLEHLSLELQIHGGKLNLTQEEIDTIRTLISGVQGNITIIQGRINSLESQLNRLGDDMNTVQIRLASISGEILMLRANITRISNDIRDIVANITRISEDVGELHDVLATLNEDLLDLRMQLNSIETQIIAIITDITEIQAEIAVLQSKTTILNETLLILNETINSLKNALPMKLRVEFLNFAHEKTLMDDYIFQVEFEVQSLGYYEAKRTPCKRYLSKLPWLEFEIKQDWLGLSAKLTVVAFWHLNDELIDINPNPADGYWTPTGKQASALKITYVIGNPRLILAANGNDDGYIADGLNDAYIRLAVETLTP